MVISPAEFRTFLERHSSITPTKPLGQSFCEHFNIVNDTLITESDNQRARTIILNTYVKNSGVTSSDDLAR